ncbi:MAG: TrmH family RNA methyltransferase [Acidimicrobiia bacterium]
MEPVRSPRNPKVAEASRLSRARERRISGLTLLEGPHVLAEAMEAGADIRRIFALPEDAVAAETARRSGAELVLVEQPVLDRLAPTESPRGPIAVMSIPPPGEGDGDAVFLAVTDPGNAGTIIRTAAAFGLDVCAAEGAVDLWSPKVVRAGAGSHFRTRFVRETPTATIATVVAGGVAPRDLPSVLVAERRWAVLVGSEAHGLPADLADAAEVRVTIPMPGGTESLNAAVAAAIVMYELAEWRAGFPGADLANVATPP